MICIIMPVYNTENYLEEAIESVLSQTLPFEENIKLQLVDDASTDGSLEICKRYEEMYPNNISVAHFDSNKGVSAARNYAVQLYRGKKDCIVGFMDSDDKLDENALQKVKEFMDSHPGVNLATMEIYFFDAMEKEHKLNWRFAEREVVSIKKDYNFPQYYIGGCFLRGSALETLHFDEKMSFWEDALAVNEVILAEGQYGLIKDSIYYYRRRSDASSLVDQAWRDEERYHSFLDNAYIRLMNYCKKKKFRVIPYIQFVVAYHMRVFMFKSKNDVVGEMLASEEKMTDFRERLQKILKKISVKVIINIPTSLPIMEAMLSMRSGKQIRANREYEDNDCVFTYKGKELARLSERSVNLFYIIHDEPEYAEFEGMWRGRFSTSAYAMKVEDYIFAEHDGVRVKSQEYKCRKQLFILGKRIRCYFHAGFAIPIPEDWESATFGIHMDEGNVDVMLNTVVFAEVEQKDFSTTAAAEEITTIEEE